MHALSLKFAKIVPVYKNGDKTNLINYRANSILPCISKIFENSTCSKVADFLKVNNVTTQEHFGFRKLHSTNHAALDVVSLGRDNLENDYFLTYFFSTLEKRLTLYIMKYF